MQLMPFAEEEVIAKLEQNLSDFTSVTRVLDEGKTPEEMLGLLLSGLDLEITDTRPAAFCCNCSRERVERAIISIGRKEIREMIEEQKPISVNCHFVTGNTAFHRPS